MRIAGAVRRALIAAAFAFVVIPGGVAHAQVFGVAGYEQVTQQQGILSGQFASLVAACPAGKQVVGGGFDVGTSGTLEVSSSAPVASGNLADERWQLFVRNAGGITQTATVVAVCVNAGLPGYETRTVTASVPAFSSTDATVFCSPGKKVLGGGFQLETASALKPFYSLPRNAQSSFIENGWGVFAQNTDSLDRQMTAYAICVDDNVSGYELATVQPSVAAGATLNVSATCAASRKVTGGGFGVETPADVSVLSSEPGNDLGVAIENGWTSRVTIAGSSPRGVTVAAICVDVADLTPPDTTITTGPTGPTTETMPTFTFTSTESGSTFECRIDAAAFAPCDSPFTTAALNDAAHTFEVRAVDAFGNPDPTPASRSFTVDTTAPNTTITNPPTSPTADTTPTFTPTSTEAGSTFECRVDTAAFAPCDSPFTTAALNQGDHTLEVRATDAAGNVDPSAASHSFTVDTIAPDTIINGGPAGPTTSTTPTFEFGATEAGTRFDCRVDAGAFAECRPPFTTAALPSGAHTFEVRATDAAGNVDPTPASRTFTVVTPGVEPLPDRDGDTVPDVRDNCVDVANPSQADKDADAIGDACDQSDASVGPTLARAVVGRVVSGEVFARFPAGRQQRPRSRARAAQVPAGYVPLKGAEVLPLGTVVDTRRGRLALTSAASRIGGRTQTQRAQFFDGIFQIKQRRAKRPTTDLTLRSSNFVKVCGSRARSARAARGGAAAVAAAAKRSRKVVSRLWGNGKGRFRTSGRHSAATLRGTIWLTEERCDGTLTRVTRGIVSVRDLRTRRTVIVRAGRSYLARAVRASVRTRRP